MKDLFGKALLDYQNGNYTEDIITSTSISDDDVLPLPYLFRNYSKMPELEKKALQLSKGKVLDVGSGAGNHSLYLKGKGFDAKSIEKVVSEFKLKGVPMTPTTIAAKAMAVALHENPALCHVRNIL